MYIYRDRYIYAVLYDSLLPSPLFLPSPLPMLRNIFRDHRSGWEGEMTRICEGVVGLVPTGCPRLTKFTATVCMCLTHRPLSPNPEKGPWKFYLVGRNNKFPGLGANCMPISCTLLPTLNRRRGSQLQLFNL